MADIEISSQTVADRQITKDDHILGFDPTAKTLKADDVVSFVGNHAPKFNGKSRRLSTALTIPLSGITQGTLISVLQFWFNPTSEVSRFCVSCDFVGALEWTVSRGTPGLYVGLRVRADGATGVETWKHPMNNSLGWMPIGQIYNQGVGWTQNIQPISWSQMFAARTGSREQWNLIVMPINGTNTVAQMGNTVGLSGNLFINRPRRPVADLPASGTHLTIWELEHDGLLEIETTTALDAV